MYNLNEVQLFSEFTEKYFFILRRKLQSVENELKPIKVLKAKFHFEYQQEKKCFFRFWTKEMFRKSDLLLPENKTKGSSINYVIKHFLTFRTFHSHWVKYLQTSILVEAIELSHMEHEVSKSLTDIVSSFIDTFAGFRW